MYECTYLVVGTSTRSQDRCVYLLRGAREIVTSSTGGHFDSAGPDKKQDAMSCELHNTMNNDLRARVRSTSIRKFATPIHTLVYFRECEAR